MEMADVNKIVNDIISSVNAARYVAGIRVNGNRYWDHYGEIRVWTAAGKLASNYKRETGDNLKGARQVLRRLLVIRTAPRWNA
jgi:bacterioferritin (cytochrome b1)